MNGDTLASHRTLATKAPLDYHNWVHLNPGDRVIIKRNGFQPEYGTVDDLSEDARYFWGRVDGLRRILIFHADGQ